MARGLELGFAWYSKILVILKIIKFGCIQLHATRFIGKCCVAIGQMGKGEGFWRCTMSYFLEDFFDICGHEVLDHQLRTCDLRDENHDEEDINYVPFDLGLRASLQKNSVVAGISSEVVFGRLKKRLHMEKSEAGLLN